jgi:acyl-CoA reductase-like NAD-dependent aldehyde dehydrogenase
MDTNPLDLSLAELKAHRAAWAALSAARKADYAKSVLDRYARLAPRQVELSNRAKGIPPDSPLAGEEWAQPYIVMRTLRLLRDSLRQIARTGRPPLPRIRTRANGQVVARVFPLSLPDRILYPMFHGEIWMRPGVTQENLAADSAAFYRQPHGEGAVALVLGAGNVAAIGPTDLAQKLFVEGRVCLFKHNPVNAYLAPILEEAFGDLTRDGFLRFCAGGAEEGKYLAEHPAVDEIHLTGSDRTYGAIVFGDGPEAAERQRNNQPRCTKRVTAELGNVTPVIVVPGPWSDGDFEFHAHNIATQVVNNAGFNCLSSRVLVTHRAWPGTGKLLDAIRRRLAALPPRPAYYPGAEKRYAEVLAANPAAEALQPRREGVIPYTLIPHVDPRERANPCFATECFVPVLAHTALEGASAAEFLKHAVEFANGRLWGTLGANLIVHPRTARELATRLEDAVAALRYGTVALNQWVAMGYVWGSMAWGAFPGSTPADIQSGVGFVHNTFLLDQVEKSVVYGPFRPWPRPPWFAASCAMGEVFRRGTRLEEEPGVRRALSVALASLKS